MSADKAAVERELQEAWDEVHGLVDSLPEAAMEQAGVVEEWSVKDLLGHMAFWAEKASHDLLALAGGADDEIRAPGGEEAVAEWNRAETERRRGASLAAAREEWEDSFEAAKDALRACPAEALDREVQGWPQVRRFAGDTYEHYREHAAQLRAWLRRLETSEV